MCNVSHVSCTIHITFHTNVIHADAHNFLNASQISTNKDDTESPEPTSVEKAMSI